MGQHERLLFSKRGVEPFVELVTVLIDELVLCNSPLQYARFLHELPEDFLFYSAEVSAHRWGFDRQTLYASVVFDCFNPIRRVNLQKGVDEFWFNLFSCGWIEVSDLEQIGFLENLSRDPELFRRKPKSCNSSAFPVSTILHLYKCLEQMPTKNRFGAGKADHAAAAFGLHLATYAHPSDKL